MVQTVRKIRMAPTIRNKKGSVMAITLMLLTAATLLALAVHQKSTTDVLIATNASSGKRAFFNSDSGMETARELIEQNIACPDTGFPIGSLPFNQEVQVRQKEGVLDDKVKLWTHNYQDVGLNRCTVEKNATLTIPKRESYTAFSFKPDRGSSGSANTTAEGYEGYGFSAAKGGVFLVYDIWTASKAGPTAESALNVEYRHLVGQEEECHY